MGIKSEEEKLITACQQGRVKAVQELFAVSLSTAENLVNSTSPYHKTPLYYAIVARSYHLVRLLIKHGADVNKTSTAFYGRDCSSPSFETCDESPIVTASRIGCTDILRCLLRNESDPNRQAEIASSHHLDARVPLMQLECHRPNKSVEYFKRQRRPFEKFQCSNFTEFSDDSTGSNIRRRSGNFNGSFGMSALHCACETCEVENVRLLLSYAANVDAEEGRRQEKPLHIAVRCQQELCSKQCEVIELLCSNGADIKALNKRRHSPFYLAALYGCAKKVEILLKYGASPNPQSSREVDYNPEWGGYGSAMHVAAYRDFLSLAVVLINCGADINWVNSSGMTPLHLNIAVRNRSNVAALLIFHGALLSYLPHSNNNKSQSSTAQQASLYSNDGTSLLSKCLSNPRLDCESLSILLVQAGYDLNQDPWLIPDFGTDNMEGFPRRVGDQNLALRIRSPITSPAECRVSRLCKWLRMKQQTVRSLCETCRAFIRRYLAASSGGKSIVPGVNKLPLPPALQNFLLLKSPSGKNIEEATINCFHELQ